LRITGDYPPGSYVYDGTVTDVNGCASSQFSVTLTMQSSPVVTAASLDYATNTSGPWNPMTGDLTTGYELCLDPAIPYFYFDINSLTVSQTLASATLNPFTLSTASLPPDWSTYWTAKGVTSGATPGTWQAVMYQIISGNAPMFYINYDGGDYQLIDGLVYQTGGGLTPLRVSGDYPEWLYTFTGTVTAANGCTSSPLTVTMEFLNCSVHLKDILQGPYDPATDLMRTDLNAGGYLPLTQPYASTPLAYAGTEAVTAFNANVVDWLVVEIRSGTAANTMVARRAALLLSDGSIVGTDQAQAPVFPEIVGGNSYYVVLYHRNHLPVMTPTAITLPNTLATRHDFTAASANAYGGDNGVFPLEAGVYGQIAGDVNMDKILRYSGDSNDKAPIITRIVLLDASPPTADNEIATGYYPEDTDMNTIVRYSGPGNDHALIFTNIDHYTDPTYLVSTFIGVVPVSWVAY